MKVKIIEVRDRNTFLVAACIDMNPENEVQRWYLRRLGFPCDGQPNIAIFNANCDGDRVTNDPYGWKHTSARTWPVAHEYILDNWDKLIDGSVVCVETILGELATPKVSERLGEG